MTENLDAFFGDFAVAATLPSTAVVMGVFDNGFVDAFGVTSSEKVFTCPAASVSSLTYGQAITIGGTAYTVAQVEPDGTGLARVRLK